MDTRSLTELYNTKEQTKRILFFTEDPETGEEGAIDGARFTNFKELSWHLTLQQRLCQGDEWTVTHVPTGLAVEFFSNKKEAKKFVSMARQFEWSFTLEDWDGYSKGDRQRLIKWVSKIKRIAQKGIGDGKKKVGSSN